MAALTPTGDQPGASPVGAVTGVLWDRYSNQIGEGCKQWLMRSEDNPHTQTWAGLRGKYSRFPQKVMLRAGQGSLLASGWIFLKLLLKFHV